MIGAGLGRREGTKGRGVGSLRARSQSRAPSTAGELVPLVDPYPTIEEAAVSALFFAARTMVSGGDRVLSGSIRRVAGGFAFSRPRPIGWEPRGPGSAVLRLLLEEMDVASWVAHPPRAGEESGAQEDWPRLVERIDPMGRPIYVLTPDRDLFVRACEDD